MNEISQPTHSSGTGSALQAGSAAATLAREIAESYLPLKVQVEMAKRLVGPASMVFEGRNLGEITPAPAGLEAIVTSRCKLLTTGQSVGETHRLVYIPASIDGVPTCIHSLCAFAEATRARLEQAGKLPAWGICYDLSVLNSWPEADKPLEEGIWVLGLTAPMRETLGYSDWNQTQHLASHPTHRLARVIEQLGLMLFNYLENAERLFAYNFVRCQECTQDGFPIDIGMMNALGLSVVAGEPNNGTGGAVVWKL